jgi:calcineurin-like phosphoesterase family protein
MSAFFWADTHFFHENIISYCNRSYASVQEMNEALETKWNETVSDWDEIYLLGDFAFWGGGVDVEGLFRRLHGRKHLIVGNHDQRNQKTLRLPWESVEDLGWFKWEGERAMLCHYPMESWKNSFHGSLMIHGHCHGLLKRKLPKRFDVGVDVEPVPVAWEDLLARAKKEGIIDL